MEKKINSLSPEDLRTIQNAKANAAYMRILADKTFAELQVAELQVKNTLLMTYLKYGLSSNDEIDKDGLITSTVINSIDDTKEETV